MRLESVRLALPSRVLTNNDVVALIEQHSKISYVGDISKALHRVHTLLELSGAKVRYWLGAGESPISLITQVVTQALEDVHWRTQDVELLIFAGVDGGFVEPANAYFVANALDMHQVHCFDISDACNGWTRALQIADALFRTGVYRKALIINSEFNQFEGGGIYPALFALHSLEELEWSFAGFTVGEGVTATLLSSEPDQSWEFQFSSRTDLVELCSAPIVGFQRYAPPSTRIGRNGVGRFTSYGSHLFVEGVPEVLKLVRELRSPIEETQAIFLHAVSKRAWERSVEFLGVSHLVYDIYPRCGNLVSASIPAGLALAIEEKCIRRGDRIASCVGSAGMSFSVCSFVY